MPRTIENPDGMFPKLTIPAEGMTAQDWQNLDKITKEMFDLDMQLDRMANFIEPLIGDPNGPSTSKRQSDARELARRIDDLPLYLASGDTKRIALEGIEIGRLSERVYLMRLNDVVVLGHRTKRGLAKGPAKKKEYAQREYERINQAVATKIKRRGTRRQPSLTAIRHNVADALGVTYSKVLDAQRGGRK